MKRTILHPVVADVRRLTRSFVELIFPSTSSALRANLLDCGSPLPHFFGVQTTDGGRRHGARDVPARSGFASEQRNEVRGRFRFFTRCGPGRAALLMLLLLSTLNFQPSTFAQTTTFTYQGFLTDSGAPANGVYDLTFTLYDAASGGSAVGASNVVNDLGITNGVFDVALDFGSTPFDGSDRWVQVAVRPGVSTGAYTNVLPRQQITSAPYAIRAGTAGNLSGLIIQQNATSPNIIAGYSGNIVTGGAVGVAIGGGGAAGSPNLVQGNYGVVGGGLQNTAGGTEATVGGGGVNTALGTGATVSGGTYNTAGAANSTIAGGYNNLVSSINGALATISGGEQNKAVGWASVAGGQFNNAGAFYSATGGGVQNTNTGVASFIGGGSNNLASGYAASVPGGVGNIAAGQYSLAAGQQAQANHAGAFVWADSQGSPFASTASGQFLIRANGGVGIGTNNPQGALHVNGAVRAEGVMRAAGGLIIENRTSDPLSPAVGQIWLRTDL